MPLFMDRHDLDGATAADLAAAHALDVEVQDAYDVRYLSYWFDYERQHGFCLVDAPTAEAADQVHRAAHGQVANAIIEVDPAEVAKFLGPIPEVPPGQAYEESAFRTILFTDIVGSTALTQRLGDSGAMEVLRGHDDIVREALRATGGSEIKHTGDGIMASFTSASRAVQCAIAMQQRFQELAEASPESAIQIRVGISAGEPVVDKGDLFGTSVQLAARLCSHADAGGILVSHAVRELCAGKDLAFEVARELELRGFAEPVRAYPALRSPDPQT